MANPSAKIPVSASDYEIPHEYRHDRPYFPSAAAAADQIDHGMQIPRHHGRPYYPSPAADDETSMHIPRRHGRPYYPSKPAGGKNNIIDPRRHGPQHPINPSFRLADHHMSKQSQPSHENQHHYDNGYGYGYDYDSDSDYHHDYNQPKLPPLMNGPQMYPSKAGNGKGNGNGYGYGYGYEKKNSKKAAAVLPVATSDESTLIKKLHEIHAHGGAATFHTEPLLESIRGILDNLDATHRFPNSQLNTPMIPVDKYPTTTQPTRPDSTLDTLPYLLHKITCMLNCKCGGGDGHALALEILELVANYAWDVKIVIVLAAFAVEFGQYGLVATLYRSDNKLVKLLAFLRQTPNVVEVEAEAGDAYADDYMIIRSKMETIIRVSRLSIEVTKLIAKFDSFPSKHIAPDAEPMLVALNQIPISVYWMIRVVIACASEHSQIQGYTQIVTSYTETWSITSLEKKMGVIWKIFTTQYELCHSYIDERIERQFYDKLKGMFSQTTIYEDNQRIFQAIFNTKENMRPLSRAGIDQLVGVDVLKRKTVLLLISDLTISHEEIAIMSRFYTDSRRGSSSQYEIVWVPIVKTMDEERFEYLKGGMPWYVVDKPNLLKPGFIGYVREEWRFSRTSSTIMVALDQRGRVVHQNARHMMMTWGNAAHPFTYRHEYEQWNITREWSLSLLLQDIDTKVSSWITEKKVICLYGGDDYDWIRRFIELAIHVANEASIELEMVYICKKVTTKEHMTRVTEVIGGRSELWSNSKSAHFWKRIESMMQSKIQLGAEGESDRILTELLYMSNLGESQNAYGWGVISGGGGAGIARATGDAIPDAFDHFEEWSDVVEEQGFTAALSDYLSKGNHENHRCPELVLPGGEDIPGIVVCAECGQPMQKLVMLACPSARLLRSSISG